MHCICVRFYKYKTCDSNENLPFLITTFFSKHINFKFMIAVRVGDKQMLELISEVCPHLIEEHSGDGRLDLCCSIKQVAEAKAQFQTLSGIVGRCPTCIGNFKRLFCDLACHPGMTNQGGL